MSEKLRAIRPMAHDADPKIFENSGANDLGLMTIEELAAALFKEPGTIRNWIARREVPFVRVGRRTMFLRASIREWLQQLETKPHGSN